MKMIDSKSSVDLALLHTSSTYSTYINYAVNFLLCLMLASLVVWSNSVNVAALGIVLMAFFHIAKYSFNKKSIYSKSTHVPVLGKVFICCLLGCFSINVLSFMLAEPSVRLIRNLDLPFRYLLFIPCFWFFLSVKINFKLLLVAASLGAVLSGCIAVYQYSILDIQDPTGAAGHRILFGCFSVILTLFALISSLLYRNKWWKILGVFGCMGGFTAVLLSGSRCAWIGFTVSFIVLLFLWAKKNNHRVLIIGLIFLMSPLLLLNKTFSEKFNERFIVAPKEAVLYFQSGLTGNYSVGSRLEMWKSAWLIFKQSPLVGSGPKAFPIANQKLIDNGIISSYVSGYQHAHNDILTVLANLGFSGLIFYLGITLFPGLILINSYSLSHNNEDIAALLGIVVSVTYLAFGFTETMFDRTMSTLFYLMLLSLCLSKCYLFKDERVKS